MKIIVAESAGFCWGVRRAMDRTLTLAETETGNVATLGPLIHNTQVVDFLKERGIQAISNPSELRNGTVIIRAHGTTPETLQLLRDHGLHICNATCPKVGKVQGIVQGALKRGTAIFIAGDMDHAEVISLQGYAGGTAVLLQKPEQVHQLSPVGKAILVAQTTFNRETYERIAEHLEQKCDQLTVHHTICESTNRRQTEVRELASRADAMIIVGGRHSANTCRLVEIASELCPAVYHVETESELGRIDFTDVETVAVSAGASSPNWLINSIVQTIRFYGSRDSWSFRTLGWLFHAHLYRAAAAFLLSTAMQLLFMDTWKPALSLIAALYIFSITNLNRLIELDGIRYVDPVRFHFIREHRRGILAAALISLLLQIPLACQQGTGACILLMAACGLGLLYRIHLPFSGKSLRIFDIPGSKNTLHALAWALVIGVLPQLDTVPGFIGTAMAPPMTAFMVVFTGSILFDIRDIQGDRFHGKETLPILIGRTRTAKLTTLILILFMAVLTGFAMTEGNLLHGLNAIGVPVYGFMLLRYFAGNRKLAVSIWFELAADGMALIPLVPALLSIAFR